MAGIKRSSPATLAQRIEIAETLKKVLSKQEGSEYWSYALDWTDARVSEDVSHRLKLARPLTSWQTRTVREELFGHLQMSNQYRSVERIAEREAALLEKIRPELEAINKKLDILLNMWGDKQDARNGF